MPSIDAAPTNSSANVPILDVSLLDGSDADHRQFVLDLRDALVSSGFLYVKNHGIPESTIAAVHAEATKLFSLPREDKVKFATSLNKSFLGWVELGSEVTYGKVDMREAMEMGFEIPPAQPNEPIWLNVQGPNNFPPESLMPGFREFMLGYQDKCLDLGMKLLHAMSETLDLPPTHFDDLWLDSRPTHHFKLNKYPTVDLAANPECAGRLGVAHHQDEDILTVLWQDDTGGLQIQNYDGQWVDVPPVPGTMVINIGDYWETLTSGRYVSTSHRVLLNTSGKDRISFPFFMMPK
ncbi:Clavaminate synthase-like protein, partial [Gonapodya prolifera JEL478]